MVDFRESFIKTLELIQSRVDNMNKKYMASYIKITGANDRTKELADITKKLNTIKNMIQSSDNSKVKMKCFALVPSVNGYLNEYLGFYNKLFNSKILDTKVANSDMSISKATALMNNYFSGYDTTVKTNMVKSMQGVGKLVKDLHSPNAGFDFITNAMRKDLSKFTNNRMALKNGLFGIEVKRLKKVNITSKHDIKTVLHALCDERKITDLSFIYNEVLFGMKHIVEYATDLLKELYSLKEGAYDKDIVPSEFDINYVVTQAMNICIILENIVSEYEYLVNVFHTDFNGLISYSTHLVERTIEFLTSPDNIGDNHFMMGDVI